MIHSVTFPCDSITTISNDLTFTMDGSSNIAVNIPEALLVSNFKQMDVASMEPGLREVGEYVMHVDNDGYSTPIISAITDVKIVKDKVTIVTFADGSQEKAVCADGDTFSVENGITICLMKKMLSDACIDGVGTSIYNNMIRYAMKKIGAAKKRDEEVERVKKAVKAARKKAHDYASDKARHNRRYWIDIISEALKEVIGCGEESSIHIDQDQLSLFIDDGK